MMNLETEVGLVVWVLLTVGFTALIRCFGALEHPATPRRRQ